MRPIQLPAKTLCTVVNLDPRSARGRAFTELELTAALVVRHIQKALRNMATSKPKVHWQSPQIYFRARSGGPSGGRGLRTIGAPLG